MLRPVAIVGSASRSSTPGIGVPVARSPRLSVPPHATAVAATSALRATTSSPASGRWTRPWIAPVRVSMPATTNLPGMVDTARARVGAAEVGGPGRQGGAGQLRDTLDRGHRAERRRLRRRPGPLPAGGLRDGRRDGRDEVEADGASSRRRGSTPSVTRWATSPPRRRRERSGAGGPDVVALGRIRHGDERHLRVVDRSADGHDEVLAARRPCVREVAFPARRSSRVPGRSPRSRRCASSRTRRGARSERQAIRSPVGAEFS